MKESTYYTLHLAPVVLYAALRAGGMLLGGSAVGTEEETGGMLPARGSSVFPGAPPETDTALLCAILLGQHARRAASWGAWGRTAVWASQLATVAAAVIAGNWAVPFAVLFILLNICVSAPRPAAADVAAAGSGSALTRQYASFVEWVTPAEIAAPRPGRVMVLVTWDASHPIVSIYNEVSLCCACRLPRVNLRSSAHRHSFLHCVLTPPRPRFPHTCALQIAREHEAGSTSSTSTVGARRAAVVTNANGGKGADVTHFLAVEANSWPFIGDVLPVDTSLMSLQLPSLFSLPASAVPTTAASVVAALDDVAGGGTRRLPQVDDGGTTHAVVMSKANIESFFW